jgi:hypothetical protein
VNIWIVEYEKEEETKTARVEAMDLMTALMTFSENYRYTWINAIVRADD